MITADSIRFGYHSDTEILHGVSLTARAGEVTTLLGPNGCGKSTLLKTMSRLVTPSAGSVCIEDRDLHSQRLRDAARLVSLMPQNPLAPPDLRVGELVARGRHPHRRLFGGLSSRDKQVIDEAVERTGITGLVDRDVAELSGGQRQRVWLAMSLAQDTPVMLLDEPTSFLDPAYAIGLLEVCRDLARSGKTVVMVLHDLLLAGHYSDELIMLSAGEVIASGRPADVLTRDTLRSVYGLEADVFDDPHGAGPVIIPRGVSV